LVPSEVHRVDVEVAVAHRGEDDAVSLRRDRCLGVIPFDVGELGGFGTVRAGAIDVIARVDRPHIATAVVRHRWAVRSALVGGGVDDPLVVGQVIGAGGAAGAGGGQGRLRRIGVHDKDLVAAVGRPGRLEDQIIPREGEISFGVLATVGEHPELTEVGLLRVRLNDPG
jgi:hypothetical protein